MGKTLWALWDLSTSREGVQNPPKPPLEPKKHPWTLVGPGGFYEKISVFSMGFSMDLEVFPILNADSSLPFRSHGAPKGRGWTVERGKREENSLGEKNKRNQAINSMQKNKHHSKTIMNTYLSETSLKQANWTTKTKNKQFVQEETLYIYII